MIVHQLADHLKQVGRASAQDLARKFSTSEDAIEAMLSIWMKRGRVKKLKSGACSGSCCDLKARTHFEWVRDPNQIAILQQ